jgi:hypothetical protein
MGLTALVRRSRSVFYVILFFIRFLRNNFFIRMPGTRPLKTKEVVFFDNESQWQSVVDESVADIIVKSESSPRSPRLASGCASFGTR